MYCTSVFLLYNQMVSPQSPFQYWMRGWLDISKAEVQPDKLYKINPSSSCVLFKGDKMGEHKQTNKKIPTGKKKNIIPHGIHFSCRFLRKSFKRKKKNHLFSSFFFFFILKNRTSGWLYITPAFCCVLRGVSCEVVVSRLVLEMMKVHLHWRDNQAGHGWNKQRQEEED